MEVWWSRPNNRGPEMLVLRQDTNPDNKQADVITLTLGQVYDPLKVLNDAVMRP